MGVAIGVVNVWPLDAGAAGVVLAADVGDADVVVVVAGVVVEFADVSTALLHAASAMTPADDAATAIP